MAQVKDRCIEKLVECGIGADEISDAGGSSSRSYIHSKYRTTEHGLRVVTRDRGKLLRALASLEPLFTNKHCTFNAQMGPPVFLPEPEAVALAQLHALGDARKKAETLASESGVKLGGVLRIEVLIPKSW